jgi:hypothetical protein
MFVLTLPADLAFTALTGATLIPAYQPSNSELRGAAAMANGAAKQVNGLLFKDSWTSRLAESPIRI